jgi:hypothetical protein
MRKIFLTGIAALFLATGTAHADPLPDVYLGRWCLWSGDPVEMYGSISTEKEWEACRDRDRHMEITQRSLTRYEDSCKFVSIKYTGEKTPMSTKPKKEDWVPVVRITARCYAEGRTGKEQITLRYIKGGGLALEKPVWTKEQCKRNAASIRIEEEHNRRLSKREQADVVKACVEQGWRSNEYFY